MRVVDRIQTGTLQRTLPLISLDCSFQISLDCEISCVIKFRHLCCVSAGGGGWGSVFCLPSNHTSEKQENNFQFGLKDVAEKAAITNALSIAKGNKSRAAELLGISRKTLYNKINQYELT